MTYEELNAWFVEFIKTERNKILHQKGRLSNCEKEMQIILTAYATFTGQDIETLNEATDKNKYYEVGMSI